MSKRHKKVESVRTGRFVRVGRDLISVTLDDRLWWKLLVPVADNDGLVFTDAHHLKLYRLVFKISGGSTDNPWANGKWMNNGRVYKDRVVPLEFLATTEGADKIAAFALVHYDQTEILCVPTSDRVRRYRRADQARPSNLLPRVRKAIWRRIRRIGRVFQATRTRRRVGTRRKRA